ncbi:uncharacterized protein BDW70DRAFT_125773 [Aspergillus foveolatus]|uniref:uncharacterized protein n=1 Tax=Aspergillus foveolatus TaxID=210207 RepID=UPI003CCDF5F6
MSRVSLSLPGAVGAMLALSDVAFFFFKDPGWSQVFHHWPVATKLALEGPSTIVSNLQTCLKSIAL